MPLPGIGIIAHSSPIPLVELGLGVEKIRAEGFPVHVHAQCRKRHAFFGGKDSDRAEAFWEYANDPRIQVLWGARGGYGAMRLLPWLDKKAEVGGKPPRKLLVGYSDSTALMEFVRERWGWATLHAAMPSSRRFTLLKKSEWESTIAYLRGEAVAAPWGAKKKLKFYGERPSQAVEAPVMGGNLCVWTTLAGSPYMTKARGKIVFLEDVDEGMYKIDRMIQQLIASGALDGARAIVLGDFQNCVDRVPSVLAREPRGKNARRMLESPKPSELKPLRPTMSESAAMKEIFGSVSECLRIPVAYGLPIGHGPNFHPLPMGAQVRLDPDGGFGVSSWDWKPT
ncbi:MAG: S66 peptidase family protein [Bdellovibrionota bacterium]